jgi:protein-S-isoprenylcysteine O-methyltransferase Ste14
LNNKPAPSNPGVKFPPPFLFLVGLGLAWLLETRVVRIRLVGGSASPRLLELAGLAILIAGLVLLFWGLSVFARVRTGIIPIRPATQIVEHGPYRFSRNPMYAGMATAYFGGALMINSGWAFVMLPLVMAALYQLVIKREERYLSSAFPKEYEDYRSRVRRWL